MKFNDLVKLILEAERKKEPDGTWRRVYSSGDVVYTKTENGSDYHRTDGPAVEHADGSKLWFVNGELHRTDGPAVEHADGGNLWYVNDKQHRLDGPAVKYANGSKRWWVNGKEYSEEDFNDLTN